MYFSGEPRIKARGFAFSGPFCGRRASGLPICALSSPNRTHFPKAEFSIVRVVGISRQLSRYQLSFDDHSSGK